ncbi:proteophosphoglycan ppg4 [Strigomonas culicis]|uniref:Proteophosphoglycan ppg4 n=1 Tax=Strigomonas culicis TaxID=28005 RepID=S9TKE7_9TRYP|nr:proteophosphoglycan ppg4 [Strigomonas culicis]|eukprot:EPY17309.1 proteophosphoglycan ppg4 [Strigomonas culicis]
MGARLCYIDESGHVVGTFVPSGEDKVNIRFREGMSLAFVFLLFASDMLDRLPQFPPELLCTTAPTGELVAAPPPDAFTAEKLEANRVFDTQAPYTAQWMVVSLLRFAVMMQRWGKSPVEVTATYLASAPPPPAMRPRPAEQTERSGAAVGRPKMPSSSAISYESGLEQNASLASSSVGSEQCRAHPWHPYGKGVMPVRSTAAAHLRQQVSHQYDVHQAHAQRRTTSPTRARDFNMSWTSSSVQSPCTSGGPAGKPAEEGATGPSPHPYEMQPQAAEPTRPGTARWRHAQRFHRLVTHHVSNPAEGQEPAPPDYFSLLHHQGGHAQEGHPDEVLSAGGLAGSLCSATLSDVAVRPAAAEGHHRSSQPGPENNSETVEPRPSSQTDEAASHFLAAVAEQETLHSVPATAGPPSSRSLSAAFKEVQGIHTDTSGPESKEMANGPAPGPHSGWSWSGTAVDGGPFGKDTGLPPQWPSGDALSGVHSGTDDRGAGSLLVAEGACGDLHDPGMLLASLTGHAVGRPNTVSTPNSADLHAGVSSPVSSAHASELRPSLHKRRATPPHDGLPGTLTATTGVEAAATELLHSAWRATSDRRTSDSETRVSQCPLSLMDSELGSVMSVLQKSNRLRLRAAVGAGVDVPYIAAVTIQAVLFVQAVGRGFIERRRLAGTARGERRPMPQWPRTRTIPRPPTASRTRPSFHLSSPPDLEDSVPLPSSLAVEAEAATQRWCNTAAEKEPPPLTAFPVSHAERVWHVAVHSERDGSTSQVVRSRVLSPISVSTTICFNSPTAHATATLAARGKRGSTAPLPAGPHSAMAAVSAARAAAAEGTEPTDSGPSDPLSASAHPAGGGAVGEASASARSATAGESATVPFVDTSPDTQNGEAGPSCASVHTLSAEEACRCLCRVLRGYQARCALAAAYGERREERQLDAELFRLMTTRWPPAGPRPPQPPVLPTPKVSFRVPCSSEEDPLADSRSRIQEPAVAPPRDRRSSLLIHSEVFAKPQHLVTTPIVSGARRLTAREVQAAVFPTSPLPRPAVALPVTARLVPPPRNSAERADPTSGEPSVVGAGKSLAAVGGSARISPPESRVCFPKETPAPTGRSGEGVAGVQVLSVSASSLRSVPAGRVKADDAGAAERTILSPVYAVPPPSQLSLPGVGSDDGKGGDTPQGVAGALQPTAAAGAMFTPLDLSLGNTYSQNSRSMSDAYSLLFNMSSTAPSSVVPDLFTSDYEFSMGEQWMLAGVDVVDTDTDDSDDEHNSESSSEEEKAVADADAANGAADAQHPAASRTFGEQIRAIGADDDDVVNTVVLLGKDSKTLTQKDAVGLIQRVGRGYLCRMVESLSLLCKLFRPDIERIARVAAGYLARRKLNIRYRIYTKVREDLNYWERRNDNAIKIQRVIRSFVMRQKFLRLQRKLQTRLELRIATEQVDESEDDI